MAYVLNRHIGFYYNPGDIKQIPHHIEKTNLQHRLTSCSFCASSANQLNLCAHPLLHIFLLPSFMVSHPNRRLYRGLLFNLIIAILFSRHTGDPSRESTYDERLVDDTIAGIKSGRMRVIN